jgi:ubiquinone/menaquinone biosynthesis C-methylase UbiE
VTSSHTAFIKKLYDDYANRPEGYEYQRWRKDVFCERDYEHTLRSLLHHVGDRHFESVLEIGCGVGTWTVHLRRYCESITVMDISKRMVEITLSRLRQLNFHKISGIVGDFQVPCIGVDEKYDGIFCIRAIEYMENKTSALSNMYRLLNPEGFVLIITKNPHRGLIPFLSLITKKTIFKLPRMFSHEIHYKNLVILMQKVGFTSLNVYPVVVSYPRPLFSGKNEVLLSNAIFDSIYDKPLNPLYLPLNIIESYCVIGRKGSKFQVSQECVHRGVKR